MHCLSLNTSSNGQTHLPVECSQIELEVHISPLSQGNPGGDRSRGTHCLPMAINSSLKHLQFQ